MCVCVYVYVYVCACTYICVCGHCFWWFHSREIIFVLLCLVAFDKHPGLLAVGGDEDPGTMVFVA